MPHAARSSARNIHENVPLPTCWQNDQIVLGTFFNGGLRAYDISNPYQPQAIANLVRRPRRRARDRNDPDSTTCSSISGRSCTASTATSAACTAWRWISDLRTNMYRASESDRS